MRTMQSSLDVGAQERNWILVPTVASGMMRSDSTGPMEMGLDAIKRIVPMTNTKALNLVGVDKGMI